MTKAPAFQLYAADFYMDTASWTIAQVGAYFRLLMHEWVNGPLPNKMSGLARIAGCDVRNMQKMWSAELAKKFTTDDANMYVNRRLELERENQNKRREIQVQKGISGATKRWKYHIAPAIAQAQPDDSSSSSSSLKDKHIVEHPLKKNNIPFQSIIDYLNEKTKRNYSSEAKSTRAHIRARWTEGKTEPDFKKVVDIKCDQWLSDIKMQRFCRPETLFGPKMDSYLNEPQPDEYYKDLPRIGGPDGQKN